MAGAVSGMGGGGAMSPGDQRRMQHQNPRQGPQGGAGVQMPSWLSGGLGALGGGMGQPQPGFGAGNNPYAYGQGFSWPGSPSAYAQLPMQNPFMGGQQPQQNPAMGIWQEGNPQWQAQQAQNGGAQGAFQQAQNPFMGLSGQALLEQQYGQQLHPGENMLNPGLRGDYRLLGGSNPAASAYQAARSLAGPTAGLNDLIATGAMGRNPGQPYLNQSIDPNTGQVTRYAAPTSPAQEYIKDSYNSPQAMQNAFTPGNYNANAPLQIQNGINWTSQSSGYTPDWNNVNRIVQQLQGVQGGDQYNLQGTANAPANTDELTRQLMAALSGLDMQGPSGALGPSNLYNQMAARAHDIAPANVFLGAQSGKIDPQTANFLNNFLGRSTGLGNQYDPAIQAGNPFQYVLGNYGQNVSVNGGPESAVTAMGGSGAAGLPGIGGGFSANQDPWKVMYGNMTQTPQQQSGLTDEQYRAAAAKEQAQMAAFIGNNQAALGLTNAWSGMTPQQQQQSAMYIAQHPDDFTFQNGRLIQGQYQPQPYVDNTQYNPGAGAFGTDPRDMAPGSAGALDAMVNVQPYNGAPAPVDRSAGAQQASAQYMAANPQMFGFDPNKSQEENYQAAAYIQAHPEQFKVVPNANGTYSISQIA